MARDWKGRDRKPSERTTRELASNVKILPQPQVRNLSPIHLVGYFMCQQF
jgi:hypothetical protein